MQYANIRGKYKYVDEPFFIFKDGSPVRLAHFRTVLRRAIKDIGLQPRHHPVHGLRSGRTTDLFKGGVEVATIEKIGRWRSDTVYDALNDIWLIGDDFLASGINILQQLNTVMERTFPDFFTGCDCYALRCVTSIVGFRCLQNYLQLSTVSGYKHIVSQYRV